MKLERILGWIDRALKVADFDDVSNNGLQIARDGDDVTSVAVAVDASVASVEAAACLGAELLVVHHGISWGGGIRRLTGGEYRVVRAAMRANLAVAAYHLPLDANPRMGNNWELARYLALKAVSPAFSYHGNVIGLVGRLADAGGLRRLKALAPSEVYTRLKLPIVLGVCSGGAGEFAADAKALGCDLYLTGEANWGNVIQAENLQMPMVLGGHYATETFGVRALAHELRRALKIRTEFVGR